MWARNPFADQLVGREGIEPPQSKTADLQSAELTTCSTYPRCGGRRAKAAASWWNPSPGVLTWSRRRDSNPEPAVYKTAALPIELRRLARIVKQRSDSASRGMIRAAGRGVKPPGRPQPRPWTVPR